MRSITRLIAMPFWMSFTWILEVLAGVLSGGRMWVNAGSSDIETLVYLGRLSRCASWSCQTGCA